MKQIILTEAKNEGRGIVKLVTKIASKGLQAVDQEDTNSLTKFNPKNESQKILKQAWRNKPLLGQHLARLDNVNVNDELTHAWLKRGKMKIESRISNSSTRSGSTNTPV